MAAFQDAAREYAAAGIVPLPIDGKKPLVSHPDRFGRRAALQIAAKPQFANAGLGFWCGSHNGLTVADIDDPKPAAPKNAHPGQGREYSRAQAGRSHTARVDDGRANPVHGTRGADGG